MDAEGKLQLLKSILNEVSDLQNARGLLNWDQQTKMPVGGTEGRAQQLSTLSRLAHERFTSSQVGDLLVDLEPYAEQLDPDSDDARIIKVIKRRYDKRFKVPSRYVAESSIAFSAAHPVWQAARQEADFSKFRPHLERIVALRQEYASFFVPYEHIYDPLLDDYEPGMKTADVQAIFDTLRPQQVEIIQAIKERPQVDDSFLHQPFDEQKQWDFGVGVITKFGYDWQRGRQDRSAHPFTNGFGTGDVRITTRFMPDFLNPALFATMHESGHALYGQGNDPALNRTTLTGGASLAVNESQSRTYENLVGRSYDFWVYFYPRLQQTFPEQLGSVSLENFYKGINKVEPSLIRVEADEATYNLHIMLRLELEIALMEGSVLVGDLPDAWNERMESYLGVTPPSVAQGVLQDIHWAHGMIGYFSTYALGNLISAQVWERLSADIPDLSEQLQRGDFTAMTGWLREKIHRHGAKFEPQELVERVTGSKIDSAAYIRYLKRKFGAIYGL